MYTNKYSEDEKPRNDFDACLESEVKGKDAGNDACFSVFNWIYPCTNYFIALHLRLISVNFTSQPDTV